MNPRGSTSGEQLEPKRLTLVAVLALWCLKGMRLLGTLPEYVFGVGNCLPPVCHVSLGAMNTEIQISESSNPGLVVFYLKECTIQTKFECVKKNFADSRRIQIGTPWGGKLSN